MKPLILLAAVAASSAPAGTQQASRSSVVERYLSLEVAGASSCAASLGVSRVAFPIDGGDASIDESFTDACKGKPGQFKVALKLEKAGVAYRLVIVEPGGTPIPIQLSLGKYKSVRLDQAEVDLSLTEYGG